MRAHIAILWRDGEGRHRRRRRGHRARPRRLLAGHLRGAAAGAGDRRLQLRAHPAPVAGAAAGAGAPGGGGLGRPGGRLRLLRAGARGRCRAPRRALRDLPAAGAPAAGRLAAADLKSMLVWVLRENLPARRFYETLGGVYLREKPLGWRGTDAVEVAYGWADTGALRTTAAG